MNRYLASFLCMSFFFVQAGAQVTSNDTDLSVSTFANLPSNGERPVCLSELPNGNLVYSNLDGDIYEIVNGSAQILYTDADHHLSYVSHMEARGDYMYLCGSIVLPGDTELVGYVMKGHLPSNTWDTLAVSEPYYWGLGFKDHRFSSLLISEDGAHVYVHSGTRTNAGEIQELSGVSETVGLRDEAIRGKLFKLPTDQTETIFIPKDTAGLVASGLLYAEGLRHFFAMAWGAEGKLYGGSNSDRRDVPEAFYEIKENAHYGFPWWIGGEQNPLQFSTYNPNVDLLLPSGSNNQGYYNPDPNFPVMPTGINFVQPFVNIGPDADKYRDPITRLVKDASSEGIGITSFSAHRSPTGLIIDTDSTLSNDFKGKAYMVSYTNSSKLLNGDGHDLLQLTFLNEDTLSARKLVSGFIKPMDVIIYDTLLYVLDMGNNNGSGRAIYQLTLPTDTTGTDTTTTDTTTNSIYIGFAENSPIQVFPNPSKGLFQVEIDASIQVQSLIVRSLNGAVQKVIEGPVSELDLRDFPAQIFLLEIKTKKGEVYTGKIVKEE